MRSFILGDNIKKYTFGNPFNTDSIINEVKKESDIPIKYFKLGVDNSLLYNLQEEDIIYGLGENVRGLNKRGWLYESFCLDDFIHTPDKKSLYGAHNFILVCGKNNFGVFIDYPSRVIFDIGYTNSSELKISVQDNNDYNLYIIDGSSLNDIVKEFRSLIGESYAPPKWAFGAQQSRWSYKTDKEVLQVIDEYDKNNMPLDCIYLDIDYMKSYKNFTINDMCFDKLEDLAKRAKLKGIRLIPIIDAGCKIEKGYDVYEEGIEKDYYCKDCNGKPFVAGVWPGRVHFPDFLNKECRRWFGLKYKFLVDKGIEGFWNDMNEPSIFYSEDKLNEAFNSLDKYKNKNLDISNFFCVKDTFLNLSNSMEDYKSFYHNVDGNIVRHDKVHNLYGFNMTRAAWEGLKEINNNKRFLLFSRASSIGMHRYGGIWTGDNKSWWEHLELNIKMMCNLNMCGFLYIGADTGGFGGDTTSDLMIRWYQFSIFTPLFRNHSAMETRRQEPYCFENKTSEILKNVLEIRYALISYLYSEFMKCVRNNEMYFKPLSFEYSDKYSRNIENQLLLGDSLMIAPIYEQNSMGRYIYLEEEMLMWKVSKWNDSNFKVLNKGHHYIDVALNEIPIFLRKNKILVINSPQKRVDNICDDKLNLIAFVEDKAEYVYYNDDGITNDYKKGIFKELKIVIEYVEHDYKIHVSGVHSIKNLNISIFNKYNEKVKKEIFI